MDHTFDTGRVFELVELEECSGSALKIYSVLIDNETDTLYDKFLSENTTEFKDEIDDIVNKLEVIGQVTGLNGKWFRRNQGNFGDGICYLFDHPDKKLRLYFILFGNVSRDLAIVIGGGGHKPQEAHALQEVGKLKDENYLLRNIASILNEAIEKEELLIDEEGFDREGGLQFKF